MKMNKMLSIVLVLAMLLTMAACGATAPAEKPAETPEQKPAANEQVAPTTETDDIAGTTIEVAVTYTNNELAVFNQLVDKFEEESGVTVNVADYGDDYEATLKTRMAANELPDVWQTHGWSILRYKEYLMDLRNEAWVSDYDDSALGVIKDSDDSIYVLMISETVNAVLANLDVCEAAGVDPYALRTYDDLTVACAKIKAAGYTPFGTRMSAGQLAHNAGTFVTYEGEMFQDGAAQLDGTWDWVSYKDTMLNTIAGWINNGYYYEDILTMDSNAMPERFAAGKAAFILGNDPSVIITCKTLNPDANFAFLPQCASTPDGVQFVAVGEGDTFGIWKDTKNEAAAKAFLEFFARPEIANEMNATTGRIAALKSVAAIDNGIGLKYFNEMKEKCSDREIFYDNFWDRKYMPSGMWSILANAANMLWEDASEDGIEAVYEYLKENYVDLYEAAQG